MYENEKEKTCWIYSKNGKRGVKENDGGVNLRYIVSAFVNVTMYPHYNNNMIKKEANTFGYMKFWGGTLVKINLNT
jgi:hypothetical protein